MSEGLTRAFFPSFPIAAVAAFVLIPIARRVAASIGFIDHPRTDRFHLRPVPLLGGAACIVAAAAGSIVGAASLPHLPGLAGRPAPDGLAAAAAFGTIALLLLGLADDRRAIPPLPKGIAMGGIILASVLIWRPSGALGGVIGGVAVWVGAMVLVNGWNYLDHADGIFGTAAGGAAAILSLAWWEAGGPILAAALAAICGCLIGYLLWNAPPARIFMGDAGSLPLGFLIFIAGAALVDGGPPGLRPASLAANAIPIIDLTLVTSARLRHRRNPFHGGREHTGHRLTARFGPRRAMGLVALATVLFGTAWVLPGSGRPGLAFVLIGAGGGLLLATIGRLPPPEGGR